MSRPQTPASGGYSSSAAPINELDRTQSRLSYAGSTAPAGTGLEHSAGAPRPTSALSQNEDFHGDAHPGAGERSSVLQRSNSQMSQSATAISRGGTLKKKASLRGTSLKRSNSRKSSYAGSVRSMKLGEKEKYESEESNSAFYCPVPTVGNPTELLANRFQSWRKVLKDLINYFRDLHKSYEVRSKTLLSASNIINNTTIPSNFVTSGGLGDAAYILRDFHKQAISEANKAKDLENEVIMQLTGLRSDLQQKIKEIKSLSGDFKNSVDKEQEQTKRAIRAYQEALGLVDHDASATTGKGDPFIVKMNVDRQVERQIDEENYLHRAYLNLEASGRELESIVVGEIQKAYTVLAGIMRREADDFYDTAEKLREGPLAISKDMEWDTFVTNNHQMVDPRNPVRQVEHITYPGKDHPAALEVRSGMLERKSKYLKNYTPGWYILSPTHLHEFKSADRLASQSPVMSLYLPEQKIGSHSEPGSSSHKFMLKGRQSGSMHRGHSWVFRAETYDTMLAWYSDVKELTEKTGEARNDFVRRTHARSMSGSSLKAPSIGGSSEGALEDDEADRQAFAGEQSIRGNSFADGMTTATGATGLAEKSSEAGWRPQQRPSPGGRFPSDLNVQRGLQAPVSPSSGGSSDRDVIAHASTLPGSAIPFNNAQEKPSELPQPAAAAGQQYTQGAHPNLFPQSAAAENQSQYGDWMAPMAAGAAGGAVIGSASHHHQNKQETEPARPVIENIDNSERQMDAASPIPEYGTSSPPIPIPIPITATTTTTEPPTGAASTAPTASTNTDINTISTQTTAPTEYSSRPGLEKTLTSKSVSTISDLHMPGEFPRNTGTTTTPTA